MKSVALFFKNMTTGKGILLTLTPITALLLDMKTNLLALAIIIFIDMLTGIRKTHYKKNIKFTPLKKEFWKSVHSAGVRSTWRKTYEYAIGIITFIILDSLVLGATNISLLGKDYSIAELAVTIACLVEVYSVYENMEAVSGNNLFKRIVNVFPEKVKSIFKSKDA